MFLSGYQFIEIAEVEDARMRLAGVQS